MIHLKLFDAGAVLRRLVVIPLLEIVVVLLEVFNEGVKTALEVHLREFLNDEEVSACHGLHSRQQAGKCNTCFPI